MPFPMGHARFSRVSIQQGATRPAFQVVPASFRIRKFSPSRKHRTDGRALKVEPQPYFRSKGIDVIEKPVVVENPLGRVVLFVIDADKAISAGKLE